MRALLALCTVVVSLGGCLSQPAGEPESPQLPTNDPVALCIELGKIGCAFQFNCCDLDDRARFGGVSLTLVLARNEGECVEIVGHLCELIAQGQQVSVERGRTQVDGAKAQSCIDKRRAAQQSCDLEEFRAPEDDCNEILTGIGGDGDVCTAGTECAEGSRCEVERNADGDPEDFDEEMGVPEGECQEQGDVGDSCDRDVFRDCQDELFCNDDNECARLPGVGDPCPDSGCAQGLDCDFDDVTGEDRCVPDNDALDFDFCKG
ncbi:MAG: hypothetical protein Q8O67_33845 [Deltaproteobacteria bacterium]|nr:hypothetical protein [Deltaproteobacteria bacterium]